MATLIDTSLWIDLTRTRSPQTLKRFIAPYVLHPDAHLAEPVAFEILRHATVAEARQLSQQFQTLPTIHRHYWPPATARKEAPSCRSLSPVGSSSTAAIFWATPPTA